MLDEIGLGYRRLGQPATTLSGGRHSESRLRRTLRLRRRALLYILDEPTTGLHFDDIAKLLAAFKSSSKPGTRCSSSSTTSMWSRPLTTSSISGRRVATRRARDRHGTPEQIVLVEASYTRAGTAARPRGGRTNAYATR